MIDPATKRKFKKQFKKHHQGAVDTVAQADKKIEKLLIRRFDRLVSVRRFILMWVSVFVLMIFATYLQARNLSPHYQVLEPVAGGLYNEGLIGSFTNANPIYATGAADAAVSRLVFSGLFKYDNDNKLVGDLATSYTISDNQLRYTVILRKNVTWQDGASFNADDVVFTYHTIQNIAAQSPLYSSWQGITVTKLDNYAVAFDIPNALSSFPYSLTNGIIPYHVLSKKQPAQLRSLSFNTEPIGTGPFMLKYIEVTGSTPKDRQQRISFVPFADYWAGRPKLDGLSIITYNDDQAIVSAFEKKQLNAASGLEQVPAELAKDKTVEQHNTPLTTAVMAFFNNSRAPLNDVNVRKALTASVNRNSLINLLGSVNQLVDSPLLKGQLGYDASVAELGYNLDYANQLLDQQGWAKGANGIRAKDGKTLSLGLSAQNSASYTKVAEFLQSEWSKIGVKVTIDLHDSNELQASVIGSHAYDILLYGINIGVDPDVYAYWDSSQASLTSQGHLNLSEYQSAAADAAIEAGRTRSDPTIRAVKYRAFQNIWSADAPAVALYQPNYLYVTRGPVFNYDRKANNSSVDRFYNVNQWMVRQQHKNVK